MKVMVIYAHPWDGSFNHQILEATLSSLKKNGHEADLLDLYKDKFDPILDEKALSLYQEGGYVDPKVEDYQKRIKDADYLIFIFPIWWVSMPAILKGFFDKVFLKKFAFDTPGKMPVGLIKHIKGAGVFTTMSSPNIYYNLMYKRGIMQNLIKGTLKFSGIKNVKWISCGTIDSLDSKRADKWLKRVSHFISKI